MLKHLIIYKIRYNNTETDITNSYNYMKRNLTVLDINLLSNAMLTVDI